MQNQPKSDGDGDYKTCFTFTYNKGHLVYSKMPYRILGIDEILRDTGDINRGLKAFEGSGLGRSVQIPHACTCIFPMLTLYLRAETIPTMHILGVNGLRGFTSNLTPTYPRHSAEFTW